MAQRKGGLNGILYENIRRNRNDDRFGRYCDFIRRLGCNPENNGDIKWMEVF